MRFIFPLVVILLLALAHSQCHYSCASCSGPNYYQCTTCNAYRGKNLSPIYGMCYCDNSSDEDQHGNCTESSSQNFTSKFLIIFFIVATLILAIFAVIAKGQKYFLYKTIEDIQELSLIVFINMYFPQQFDPFLTYLYRFNISSYTFQNLAEGSLYVILPDSSVATVDAQNIYGKYRLLLKTANFFGNQFTWIIVVVCILAVAVGIKFWRNWLKKHRDYEVVRKELDGSKAGIKENRSQLSIDQSQHVFQLEKKEIDQGKCGLYCTVNKIYNILWFNFLIVFFYFSLIQININIFTQIGNLTFSSNFATTGAFFSAVFLAGEIVLLTLLFLKAREEMIKPEWMRDTSFIPTIYLIRTNYKTITKYFWFISCLKKVLLAMVITLIYYSPLGAIVAVCIVHTLYLSLAIYCQPYERKYIRAHFYLTQGAKLFLFLSLINFTTKYNSSLQLISLTVIFYAMMAFVFGMHMTFLLISIIIERDAYKYFLIKRFCSEEQEELKRQKVGYRSEDKVYIYLRE